jgi:hypothetical protein
VAFYPSAKASQGDDAPPLPKILAPPLAVTTAYLKINWSDETASPGSSEAASEETAKVQRAKACTELGRSLKVGAGLWGSGLFDDFGCYEGGTVFAGTPEPVSSASAPWLLQVDLSATELKLSLTLTSRDGAEPRQAGAFFLDGSPWTLDLLGDQTYGRLLATALLDAMPAAMRLSPEASTGKAPFDVKLQPKATAAAGSPRELTVFEWALGSGGFWRARVRGKARLVKGKDANGATVRLWRVTLDPTPSTDSQRNSPLYAQRSEGPEQATPVLKRLLLARQKTLLTDSSSKGFSKIRQGLETALRFATLDNFASGYAGFRYGREMVDPKTALFPPASVFGLLAEFRSGPAKGLRIYGDIVPREPKSVAGETAYMSWQRLLVGWGFGYSPPWVFTRLEVAPKVGQWTIDSRLPDVDGDGNVTFRKFRSTGALSFGLELSAEVERPQYLVRFWYGRDLSTNALGRQAFPREVTSERKGLDALLKGPRLNVFGSQWHLSYLLFGYYDDLEFTGKGGGSDLNPTASSGSGAGKFSLQVKTAFAGGGLSLSW